MSADSRGGAVGREFTLGPQHAALLFALYGQAPPPVVSDALSGFPTFMYREKMQRVEAEMVENGTLQRSTDGGVELAEDVADLLAMCFDSDDAVTLEPAGGTLVTAYFAAERTVVISQSDGDVRLTELLGSDGREAWLSDCLLDARCHGGADPFVVSMTVEELDALLTERSEGGTSRVEEVCAEHGWDGERMAAALGVVLGDGPVLKATAVRSGLPGVSHSRVGLSSHGAWVLKVVAMSEDDFAQLGWHPDSSLLEVIRGFGDQ